MRNSGNLGIIAAIIAAGLIIGASILLAVTRPWEKKDGAGTAAPPSVSDTAPISATEPVVFPEATEKELAELVSDEFGEAPLLNALNETTRKIVSESHYTFSLSADTSPEDCLFSGVVDHKTGISALYEYYFGESEIVEREPDDPWRYGYAKYPADKINWIAVNVLNLRAPDPEKAENGFYCSDITYVDMHYWMEARITGTERLEDGKYRFTVAFQGMDFSNRYSIENTGTLIAAIKELDGRRFWSFYSYHAEPEFQIQP